MSQEGLFVGTSAAGGAIENGIEGGMVVKLPGNVGILAVIRIVLKHCRATV